MSGTPDREFDLVLWGATGFTGSLVSHYIADHAEPSLRWAIAGRNAEKLAALRTQLSSRSTPEVLTADLTNADGMRALTARTRVLISTVGPYARFGKPVIAACVETHTDYCDLTGEVPWIREIIDEYHDIAEKQGTRLVHCCGFDSIPSDLGVLLLHLAAKNQHMELREVKLFSAHLRGGVSGGTIASMMGVLDQARDRTVRRLLGNPYALDPRSDSVGPDGGDPRQVRFDPDLERWTHPFVMAAINSRIVRRSNALMNFAYGKEFRYSEQSSTRRGLFGWWSAQKLRLGLVIALGLAATPWTRRLLVTPLLPEPGHGPSPEDMESGSFQMLLVGRATGEEQQVRRLLGVVSGQGDPGYRATAKMLAESALCLVENRAEIPDRAGVLTPAVALGTTLVRRLRNAGMTLEVHSWPAGSHVLDNVENAYRDRRRASHRAKW